MTPPELIQHSPVSEVASRIFVAAVTLVVVVYDVCCLVMGWPTVSHAIRSMDQ